MTVGSIKGRNGVPERPDPPKPAKGGYVWIPAHLVPPLQAIAKRQETTVAVIVAQAIRDYCEGGL